MSPEGRGWDPHGGGEGRWGDLWQRPDPLQLAALSLHLCHRPCKENHSPVLPGAARGKVSVDSQKTQNHEGFPTEMLVSRTETAVGMGRQRGIRRLWGRFPESKATKGQGSLTSPGHTQELPPLNSERKVCFQESNCAVVTHTQTCRGLWGGGGLWCPEPRRPSCSRQTPRPRPPAPTQPHPWAWMSLRHKWQHILHAVSCFSHIIVYCPVSHGPITFWGMYIICITSTLFLI